MQEEELGMHGIDDEEEEEVGWELRTRSGVGAVLNSATLDLCIFCKFPLFVAQIFQLSLDMQVQLCPANQSFWFS